MKNSSVNMHLNWEMTVSVSRLNKSEDCHLMTCFLCVWLGGELHLRILIVLYYLVVLKQVTKHKSRENVVFV